MSRLTHLIDLASQRFGGAVLTANDDFFASKDNLVKPAAAISIPDKYTDCGKWMDGWETRRRRTPGHDWCIVKLGLPGVIRSIVVDTAFFRGNFPSHCSVDVSGSWEESDPTAFKWRPLVGHSELRGDAENVFAVESSQRVTHLRLNIFPDGGVARLRVLGEALPDWRRVSTDAAVDLTAIANGAHIVDASDRFFGEPANMLMPDTAANTGEGWETKRRRGPGHDWVVIRLGTEGAITGVELDTAHFKGNYPESFSLEAAVVEELAGSVSADLTSTVTGNWQVVLPRTTLEPDHLHRFASELRPDTIATHVRLNIFPDGGVSRLRVLGSPSAKGRQRSVLRFFNSLDDDQFPVVMSDYCGAPTWVERMSAARPFDSAAALLAAADKASEGLSRADWLEAFRHHPRIGERTAERAQSATARASSAGEQDGVAVADAEATRRLADANHAYEERFGHLFIVSAAGRNASEILSLLDERMKNDAAHELDVAAAEQRRITRLRLEKAFG